MQEHFSAAYAQILAQSSDRDSRLLQRQAEKKLDSTEDIFENTWMPYLHGCHTVV